MFPVQVTTNWIGNQISLDTPSVPNAMTTHTCYQQSGEKLYFKRISMSFYKQAADWRMHEHGQHVICQCNRNMYSYYNDSQCFHGSRRLDKRLWNWCGLQ